jgi:phage/plasmid-associated DNA primase
MNPQPKHEEEEKEKTNVIDLAAATEALRQATAAIEEAKANPRRACSAYGWICNAKGEPSGPSERFWIDALAASKDFIFDPLCEAYFHFSDGLWIRKTKAETRETVDSFIRQRMEGEGELNLDKLLSKRALDAIVERLAGHPCVAKRDAFANPPHGVILVENGRIEISRDGKIKFGEGSGLREDLQQTRLPISYDPEADATKTEAWLTRIFSGRKEDVLAIAKMAGACLWGSNRWKKMTVIHGKANMGKSQIPLLIERLIGRQRVSEFETRRLGEKFEMRRFVGKVFLRAEDVEADFMTRTFADTLKQLTGFGSLRVEGKNSHEEFELRGDKVICATSNFRLRVRADVDRSAWEERLVYLEADGKAFKREEQDSYFLDNLFSSEGSGILNFALQGLVSLLTAGWERSEEQMARIKRVMEQGDSVAAWARACVGGNNDDPQRPGITISEAWASYLRWAEENKIEVWPERIWREMAVEALEKTWGKTTSNNLERGETVQRGWRGVSLRRSVQ